MSPGRARIANVYSDRHHRELEFDTLVTVTSRAPDDDLLQALVARQQSFQTLRAIGDCHAPGTVAAAVYDGHSAARRLQSKDDEYAPLFTRDLPLID